MLQVGFYTLLSVVLFILGFGFNQAAINAGYTDDKRRKFIGGYALLMGVWLIYVHLVGASGVLKVFSLPPRMPIFLILPAFMMIFWFFRAKKFKPIFNAFPTSLTVYYQSFRIFVELLILGTAIEGLGPYLATFEGRNFEILAGLSAPIIGYLAYTRKTIGPMAVIVWNICGLLLLANIVFIFLSASAFPEFWGFAEPPFTPEFTNTPYIYIASVFMPSAVFMHVFSIRKSLHAIKQNASL